MDTTFGTMFRLESPQSFLLQSSLLALWHFYGEVRRREPNSLSLSLWAACVSTCSSLGDSQTANIISVEVAGYAARAASYNKTDQLPPYVIQYLLILVAPALFAASIYMILGRIIRSVQGERHSPIRPVWLTRIFVTGDTISFATQLVGGGL